MKIQLRRASSFLNYWVEKKIRFAEYVRGISRILSSSNRRLVGGGPEATLFFQSIAEIHLKVSSPRNRPQLRLHNNAISRAAFCLRQLWFRTCLGFVSACSVQFCNCHIVPCTWPNPKSVQCKLFMKHLHRSLVLLQHFTSEGIGMLIYSMNPYGTDVLGVFINFMRCHICLFLSMTKPINPWSLSRYGTADPSHLWLKPG